MARIRKAIIPAAGLGTRFLPATKAMPKEMLPIVDKPAIQYIVEEAVQSGIEDILIVTGRSKRSIEDHFDRNCELEANLKEKRKYDLLKMVNEIVELADIHYIRQKSPRGVGHAIWCARKFIGHEPFAVLLGDMVIDSPAPCLQQLIEVYEKHDAPVVGVAAVASSEVRKFGIIDGVRVDENLYQVNGLVEKPAHHPPSNMAIMGRYVLRPNIFEILEHTKPGVGGEIQLTDALHELAKKEKLLAFAAGGKLYDIGSKLGFLQATIEFAYKNSSMKTEFDQYMRQFFATGKQSAMNRTFDGGAGDERT
ncbi:MAG TPA: UTP--glucose-1-phosphate uridylyltransferase GalU [Bacilli bacterium]